MSWIALHRPSLSPAAPIAAVLAALAGVGVAFYPMPTIAVVLGVAILAVAMSVRLETLVSGMVLTSAVGATVRIGLLHSTPLLGQGRLVLLVAAFALLRFAFAPVTIRIPRETAVVVGAFVVSVFISAGTAYARGTAEEDLFDVLQREVIYVLGGLSIGLIAANAALSRGTMVSLYRGLARVLVLVSVLAALAWLGANGMIPLPGPVAGMLDAIAQTAIAQNWQPERLGIPFSDQNPNLAAIIYVSLAAFATAPLLLGQRKGDRWLAALALVGAGSATLITQSRAGLAVLVLAVVSYVMLTRRLPGRVRATFLSFATVAVAVAIALAGSLFPEDRALTNVNTLSSRTEIWKEALSDVASHPVAGLGFGVSRSPRWGESIHNEFLGRLVDGGILHLVPFILVLLMAIRVGFYLWKQQDPLHSAIGVGALSWLAAMLTYMMISATWGGSPVMAILSWMFFGVMIAASEDARVRHEQAALGARLAAARAPRLRNSPGG